MEGAIPSRETTKSRKSLEWIATLSATKVGIDTRMAIGIVELSLFVVREDFVSFCGLFEFVRCIFIILQSDIGVEEDVEIVSATVM